MHPRPLIRAPHRVLPLAVAIGMLSACSGGGESAERPAAQSAATACATPTDTILGGAARKFVAQVDPKPHRLLIPVGDAGLPVTAQWGLQATGATLNFYPRDTAAQKKTVQQLAANGSYTLLLINYHGQRKLDDGRTAVDFSGEYMSGEAKGKTIPRTGILFSCQATGERFSVEARAPGA